MARLLLGVKQNQQSRLKRVERTRRERKRRSSTDDDDDDDEEDEDNEDQQNSFRAMKWKDCVEESPGEGQENVLFLGLSGTAIVNTILDFMPAAIFMSADVYADQLFWRQKIAPISSPKAQIVLIESYFNSEEKVSIADNAKTLFLKFLQGWVFEYSESEFYKQLNLPPQHSEARMLEIDKRFPEQRKVYKALRNVYAKIKKKLKAEEESKDPIKKRKRDSNIENLHKKILTCVNYLTMVADHQGTILSELRKRNTSRTTVELLKIFEKENVDLSYKNSSVKIDALIHDLFKVRKKAPGEKMLVFSHYVSFLYIIRYHLLRVKGFDENDIVMYHGGMNNTDKSISEDKFKNGKACIMLMSYRVGIGLNLFVANHVFLTGPPFTYTDKVQAVARAFRLGQKKNVYVTSYMVQNTPDVWKLSLMAGKQQLSEIGNPNRKTNTITSNETKRLYNTCVLGNLDDDEDDDDEGMKKITETLLRWVEEDSTSNLTHNDLVADDLIKELEFGIEHVSKIDFESLSLDEQELSTVESSDLESLYNLDLQQPEPKRLKLQNTTSDLDSDNFVLPDLDSDDFFLPSFDSSSDDDIFSLFE